MPDNDNHLTSLDPTAFQQLIAEFLENRFRGLLNELKFALPKNLILPTCYISYPREADIDDQVKLLAEYLLAVGMPIQCDLMQQHQAIVISRFIKQIDTTDAVIILGTPILPQQCLVHADLAKLLEFNPQVQLAEHQSLPPIVVREMARVQKRLEHNSQFATQLILVRLEGTTTACFPPSLQTLGNLALKRAEPAYATLFHLLQRLLPEYHALLQRLQKTFTDLESVKTWQNNPDHIEQLQQSINAFVTYKKQQQDMADQYIRDQLQSFLGTLSEPALTPSISLHVDNNNHNEATAHAEPAQLGSEAPPIASWLKQYYQGQGQLPLLLYDRAFPIEQNYINLTIIENKKSDKPPAKDQDKPKDQDKHEAKESNQPALTYLSSFEEIYAEHKESIPLEDMFKPKNGKTPQHLLIEGRAGVGKSTLCRYLAHQWAQGKLFPQFTGILWIPLRNLIPYADHALTLANVVRRECLPPKVAATISETAIHAWLQQHAKTVLWLLDGYDEVAGLDETSAPGQFLKQLLSQTPRILTSRPGFYSPAPNERHLETIGFTDANIQSYIEHFYQQIGLPDAAKALKQRMQQQVHLRSMAHIPINLELLCSSIASASSIIDNDIRLTAIYQRILTLLLRYHLLRKGENVATLTTDAIWQHPHCQALLQALSAIAWQGLQQRSLILTSKEYGWILKQLGIDRQEDLLQELFYHFNLLKHAGQRKQQALEQDYYFVHLTFQEFFAARYLVAGLKAKSGSPRHQQAVQFIRLHKYDLRWQLVLSFIAGLLKKEPSFATYWQLIQDEPRDVIGLYALCLEMRILEEAGAPEPQTKDWLPRLLQKLDCHLVEERVTAQAKTFSALPTYLSMSQQITAHPMFSTAMEKKWLPEMRGKMIVTKVGQLEKLVQALPQYANQFLSSLLAAISDQSGLVRRKALRSLGQLVQAAPPLAEAILPGLLAAINDQRDAVHHEACLALGQLVQTAPSLTEVILSGLLAAVKDKNDWVREKTCRTLGRLAQAASPLAEAILPILLTAVNDKNDWVREEACEALGRLAQAAPPLAEAILPILLAAINDQRDAVRGKACLALSQLAQAAFPLAEAILPNLLTAVKDQSGWVR